MRTALLERIPTLAPLEWTTKNVAVITNKTSSIKLFGKMGKRNRFTNLLPELTDVDSVGSVANSLSLLFFLFQLKNILFYYYTSFSFRREEEAGCERRTPP